MNKLFSLLLLCAITVLACSKDEIPEPNVPELTEAERMQLEQEIEAIKQYLSNKGWVADFQDESGVFVMITQEGDGGDHPNLNSNVRVKYKGYDLSEDVFDSNANGVTFPLNGLILGWQIGIPYFTKGTKGVLLIPSYLAYRNNSPSNGAPIVFEIELVDF